jgi:hypothetical protein
VACALGEDVSVGGALVAVGGVLEGEVLVDGVPWVGALGVVLDWVDALGDVVRVEVVLGDGALGVA